MQSGLLAADRYEGAELTFRDGLAQLCHRGMEATVKSNREHDAGALRGLYCLDRVPGRQGERLFHEHVLSGRGRADDLLSVLAMRRGEDDGVDRGVGQDRHPMTQPSSARLGRRTSRRCQRGACARR